VSIETTAILQALTQSKVRATEETKGKGEQERLQQEEGR
jgi:hypothetical protein